MKLSSQVSRVYKEAKYEKFWVVVPSKIVKELKWKKGQNLKAEIKEGQLVVKKN